MRSRTVVIFQMNRVTTSIFYRNKSSRARYFFLNAIVNSTYVSFFINFSLGLNNSNLCLKYLDLNYYSLLYYFILAK